MSGRAAAAHKGVRLSLHFPGVAIDVAIVDENFDLTALLQHAPAEVLQGILAKGTLALRDVAAELARRGGDVVVTARPS